MRVSDKLTKVNDTVTVNIYDNGFMLEVGGTDHNDNWSHAKIVCNDLETVTAIIQEVVGMEKQ